MAERSVHGRIHSVFQKGTPAFTMHEHQKTNKNGSPRAPVFDTTCE